jgi:hypothetical protein
MKKNPANIILLFFVFFAFEALAQTNPSPQQQKTFLPDYKHNPSEYRHLPKNIINYLETNRCLIPESTTSDKTIGGFRGEFQKPGQTDWVVLCSRGQVSSILIFWKGSTDKVSEIAKSLEKDFIRPIDNSAGLGYFRTIGLDEVKDMVEENRALFGGENPLIDHFGIDEQTADGREVVYYLHKGRWLTLKRPEPKSF